MFASAASAQEARISNATLQTRSAASGLEPAIRLVLAAQAAPAWIGYSVPIVAGSHYSCCNHGDNCCGGCSLESKSGVNMSNADESRSTKLEGAARLLVLLRVEQNVIGKVRSFTDDCALDAGGLPVYWLTDVQPPQSVAFLTARMNQPDDPRDTRKRRSSVMAAIALHADESADRALEGFLSVGRPEETRKQAAFWIATARGRHGYEVLRRMVKEDASDAFREHAVFALTQSTEPEAIDTLIRVARDDRSARVRGQALFWLANKAGKKAEAAITTAIEQDPNTDVKKKAVFALSQLPRDEGIPLLIQVARTNQNPAVRKQAMFWLGQSNDIRALEFFEQVLKR
jgi:HEAT repeat protein